MQCFLEASLSYATGEVNQIKLPKTHKQAMEADADAWGEAERSEFTALEEMETFELTQLPEGKRALPTKWIYALKTDADGNIVRYKARIVVRGDLAEEGVDYYETFSPVARWESVRTFLALTTLYNLKPMQADIQVAYLSAELDEEIYIRPPDGVKRLPPGYVYRLRRSMYGLPQAGRNFNRHFNDKLLAAGFKQL